MRKLDIRDITSMAKRETIPISVLVEVCYTCNESCIHCCLSDHSKKGLTAAQYDELFDQFVAAGTFFVILTGGEPFTRKDFMEIVESARKRRISVTIFTNGTLVTEDIAADLAGLWVQEVHISLYGADAKVHDGVTRVAGSFEGSLQAVKRLQDRGVTVRLKVPLMNLAAASVPQIKQLAADLGAPLQFTTVITARDNGDSDTHSLRLTDEQLRALLADEAIDKHGQQPVMATPNDHCVPCDTVFNGGAIDPYGNVYPCNQLQILGGNVLERSFGEIWSQSPAFQMLREIRLNHLSSCPGCELLSFCTRCPGLALLEDGDLKGCSSAAKRLAMIRYAEGFYPIQSHIFSKI